MAAGKASLFAFFEKETKPFVKVANNFFQSRERVRLIRLVVPDRGNSSFPSEKFRRPIGRGVTWRYAPLTGPNRIKRGTRRQPRPRRNGKRFPEVSRTFLRETAARQKRSIDRGQGDRKTAIKRRGNVVERRGRRRRNRTVPPNVF